MNHFYRVVFNRALGVIQVAAETARAHSKISRGKKRTNKPKTPSRIANGLAAAIALELCVLTLPALAIDVANETDWNTAVSAVAAAGAGSTVSINVTSGFTLTSSLAQLQASNANVPVNITGNGQTVDGASS
jgi:hypothetical protein